MFGRTSRVFGLFLNVQRARNDINLICSWSNVTTTTVLRRRHVPNYSILSNLEERLYSIPYAFIDGRSFVVDFCPILWRTGGVGDNEHFDRRQPPKKRYFGKKKTPAILPKLYAGYLNVTNAVRNVINVTFRT